MHYMNIAKHRCMHYLSQIILKDLKVYYIISNLFLDFFIGHTPMHYNHKIINVIKIQNRPLQSCN
jgi:hypothetical protein